MNFKALGNKLAVGLNFVVLEKYNFLGAHWHNNYIFFTGVAENY